MNILGIETSCDETGAAVVIEGTRILSNVVASQLQTHEKYGGVVPELAAREHLKAIIPAVRHAMSQAHVTLAEIDAIAVTHGPGLAGSLLVGVNVAKTLAYARDLPLVAVNHLESHLYANWLATGSGDTQEPQFPVLCLLVSGGHTELILMTGHGRYQHLGRTLDDAAGEAFDKSARLLGLGYPGGPAIERAAEAGNAKTFSLPRALLDGSDDFSFSGLKTALLREVSPYRLPDSDRSVQTDGPFDPHVPPVYRDDLPVHDLAAAFQEAVVDVLAEKTVLAAERHHVESVLIAGGVAANRALRAAIESRMESSDRLHKVDLSVPDLSLCTDNAAMVAGAAYYLLKRGEQAGWELDVLARAPLSLQAIPSMNER